jgi:hypothetical protein
MSNKKTSQEELKQWRNNVKGATAILFLLVYQWSDHLLEGNYDKALADITELGSYTAKLSDLTQQLQRLKNAT